MPMLQSHQVRLDDEWEKDRLQDQAKTFWASTMTRDVTLLHVDGFW